MTLDERARTAAENVRSSVEHAAVPDASIIAARLTRRRVARYLGSALVVVAVGIGGLAALDSDGGDVSVDVSAGGDGRGDDSSPLSPEIDAGQAAEATGLVEQFLGLLASDDLEAAATLWSGYPVTVEDDVEAKTTALEQLDAELDWLIPDAPPELSVTPSSGLAVAVPVVTVVSAAEDGLPRRAAAFVVSSGGEVGTAGGLRIQRLPEPELVVAPAPGTGVSPGETIVVEVMPVEGGATVHVNGVPVPSTVDAENLTTTFEIPKWARDELVITVSFATPEVPGAAAFWYPVQNP